MGQCSPPRDLLSELLPPDYCPQLLPAAINIHNKIAHDCVPEKRKSAEFAQLPYWSMNSKTSHDRAIAQALYARQAKNRTIEADALENTKPY
jgi:hypothetical protein